MFHGRAKLITVVSDCDVCLSLSLSFSLSLSLSLFLSLCLSLSLSISLFRPHPHSARRLCLCIQPSNGPCGQPRTGCLEDFLPAAGGAAGVARAWGGGRLVAPPGPGEGGAGCRGSSGGGGV